MSEFVSDKEGYTVEYFGAPLYSAEIIVVLLPGRRQSAEDIYKVAGKIGLSNASWVIPSAPGKTWYPRGFMREEEDNQPHLDWAIEHLNRIVLHLLQNGTSLEQLWMMGFSQGACIAARYLASSRKIIKGAVLFTGGLFGPTMDFNFEDYSSLKDMPILLTGSQTDSWVPAHRILETAQYFRKLGAVVTEKIYEQREHMVCDDEISIAKEFISSRNI